MSSLNEHIREISNLEGFEDLDNDGKKTNTAF